MFDIERSLGNAALFRAKKARKLVEDFWRTDRFL